MSCTYDSDNDFEGFYEQMLKRVRNEAVIVDSDDEPFSDIVSKRQRLDESDDEENQRKLKVILMYHGMSDDPKEKTLELSKNEPLRVVYKYASEQLKVSQRKIDVLYNNIRVMPKDTLEKLNIKEQYTFLDIKFKCAENSPKKSTEKKVTRTLESMLEMRCCTSREISVSRDTVESPASTNFTLKLLHQNRQYRKELKVNRQDTFSNIKCRYSEAIGISISRIVFSVDGDRVQDDMTPQSFELEEGDIVDVAGTLKGVLALMLQIANMPGAGPKIKAHIVWRNQKASYHVAGSSLPLHKRVPALLLIIGLMVSMHLKTKVGKADPPRRGDA
ncbi:hypothetical protein T12_3967 [Trichinella patagoniensis]|uniref:Ubiquitin-like domain-containing protein n=1 Tax=Trichinella patagoniensis TaxID=990121 RepID=A0A0V0ZZQ5_9BILA|nr:hypothetical protein T12_3967 [Trichinella patagoniensis]